MPYSSESTAVFIPQIAADLEIAKLRFIQKVNSGEINEANIPALIQQAKDVEELVIKSLMSEATETGMLLVQDADAKRVLEIIGSEHDELLQELYHDNGQELFLQRLYIGDPWKGGGWKIVPSEKEGKKNFVLIQQTGERFREEDDGMVVLYSVADLTALASKTPRLVQDNVLAYHRAQTEIQMFAELLDHLKLLENDIPNFIPTLATEIASSPNPREDLNTIRLFTDLMAQTPDKIREYASDLSRDHILDIMPYWKSSWEKHIDKLSSYSTLPYESLMKYARIPHIVRALEKERERISMLAKRDQSEYKPEESGSDVDILYRPITYTNANIEFRMGLRDIKLKKLAVPWKAKNTPEDLAEYDRKRVAMDTFLQSTGLTRAMTEGLLDITENAFGTYQILFNLLYLQKTQGINIDIPGVRYLVLKTTGISEQEWLHFISLTNERDNE